MNPRAEGRVAPLAKVTRVHWRLVRLLAAHGGQRKNQPGGKPFRRSEWPHQRFVEKHGLYKLLGTIRYPGGANAA